ncbi:hypothetical protein PV328_002556 [Microctonus aethiopoides]|uniref:Peptidase M12B domain-containing protein n=1 Tax=Microctonus aethiopoides TaxID=144406 RepID=A0AA39KJJ6_9HYME|nr:hypothetical protein PV328_002556 [Microctonus aethiopoides]
MRGLIFANVYIGILLVTLDASVLSQQDHQEIFDESTLETFDTSGTLPAVPIDRLHVSKRNVDQSSQNCALHKDTFDDNILEWIQPSDWALFTLDTPVYAFVNKSDGLKTLRYVDAMKLNESYIYNEYYSTSHNDRKKRQIDDITGRSDESEGSSRTKRSNGDIIYPEILVIVDYDTFELHEKNFHNLLKYLHGFWNGVDLVFRSLESPKFRLNIAAILIDESNIGLPYISSNKVNSGQLIVNIASNDFTYWLYDNLNGVIGRNKYDVAVTMTSLQMCPQNAFPGPCREVGGVSMHATACHVDDFNRMISKTAIIRDGGGFDGILATAHELGHLFGALHDGGPSIYQYNSIGSTIMSPTLGVPIGGWSQSSQDAMKQFVKTIGSCLYNKPDLSHRIYPCLPGKIKDADEQCKALEGTKAFQYNTNICQLRLCYTRNWYYTSAIGHGPAPSGTPWPDYEAVPIVQSHIRKRNVYQQTSLRMKNLDYDTSKWIQPPDEALFTLNTPVYSVKKSSRGLRYSVHPDVSFWNGVDLGFRSLESPKFRLNIAGILIAEVSIMKKLALCDTSMFRQRCDIGQTGLSLDSGACDVDDYFRFVNKAAIVQDRGSFRGIQTAIHELGHLFGAKHDGDPYNFRCNSYSGNIMDPHSLTGANVKHWSQCSLMAIDRFLKTKGRCLYNMPILDQRVTPFLPGKMIDANQQCRVLQGTQSVRIDASICQELLCYTRNMGYGSMIGEQYAAPGTRCGYQKMCIHGQCVPE